ncbi:MAG: serine hydrolase domain-containing protein [Pirellulaceae bacterium]
MNGPSRNAIVALVMFGLGWGTTYGQTVTTEDLVGVWRSQRSFGTEWNNILTISESDKHLSATIGNERVEAARSGQEVEFTLPSKQGSFRGTFKEGRLTGHWMQPPTENTNYPYAFPLEFKRTESGAWSADVKTLPDKQTLFLRVAQRDDDRLLAFIRNPERNSGISFGTRDVEFAGKQVRLLRENDEAIEGNIDDNGILNLEIWDHSYQFQREKRESNFYPSPSDEPYQYQQPERFDDGWATATPEQVGMNSSILEAMIGSIQDSQTESVISPYIHSVLVARSGKLVLEEYFHGFDQGMTHDTRSAGKSIGSLIVGAVVDNYPSVTIDSKISDIFGDGFKEPKSHQLQPSFQQRQIWRRQITVGHALGMRSGLDTDDNDDASVGTEGRMQDDSTIRDWRAFGLALPVKRKPGTVTLYSSNSINLAASSVAHASKQWIPDLFFDHIASPLGIEHYYMNLDPSGNGYMGGGIQLRPRDQLKLGQLMLNKGTWKGKRILSEQWVIQSTTPTGSMNEPNDYCLGWWRKPLVYQGRTIEVFNAGGNGGQFIVFIPELDIVVQISGGNYRNFPVWYKHLTEMIPRYIFTAIDAKANSNAKTESPIR